MLGRQVGSNLLRLPAYARLPLRPSSFQCLHEFTPRGLVNSSYRFYATPGRPRKAVGEPSRPVKRAVKRAANTPSTSTSDPASKQVKAKKASGTAKKPIAKKKTAPKKRAPKELTEEQKARKEVQVGKAQIKELKKIALSPPLHPTYTAYIMFNKEKSKGTSLRQEGMSPGEALKQHIAPIIAEWKSLSPADLEHYNHLAHSATEEAAAAYKAWVESHTPEEIHKANNARHQLRRKLDNVKGTQKYSQIKDGRAVKRPASSYLQFSVNRQASGDFKNIPLKERSLLIAKEWRALSESEKKKYKDLQSQDQSRYTDEYNNVYGHMPPYVNGQTHAAAAAA